MFAPRTIPESHLPRYKAVIKKLKSTSKHFDSNVKNATEAELDYLISVLRDAERELEELRRAARFNF